MNFLKNIYLTNSKLLILILILLSTTPSYGQTQPSINLTTTKLSTIPEGYEISSSASYNLYGDEFPVIVDRFVYYTPDGEKVAYLVRKDNKKFVLINNEISQPYDEVSEDFIVSPDSKKLAYIAQKK